MVSSIKLNDYSPDDVDRVDGVLVIGGGVGGMRAAIDLAEAGLHVYLREATPSLGGRVAQLGFMFPTHDCVLCRGTSNHGFACTRPSISPALLDHNRHPNITLLSNSDLVSCEGEAGDFHVKLHQRPVFVGSLSRRSISLMLKCRLFRKPLLNPGARSWSTQCRVWKSTPLKSCITQRVCQTQESFLLHSSNRLIRLLYTLRA